MRKSNQPDVATVIRSLPSKHLGRLFRQTPYLSSDALLKVTGGDGDTAPSTRVHYSSNYVNAF